MSDTTNAVEPGTTASSQSNLQAIDSVNEQISKLAGNTGESDDPNSTAPVLFDLAEPFDLRLNARGPKGKIPVRHVLKQPTLAQLTARDEAQPYRSQMITDEIERPIADVKNTADVNLYDKLVLLTEGYRLNVVEGQTPEERAAALKAIPPTHKKNVISQILPVETKYVPEPMETGEDGEDTEVFKWGENLTYKFECEFGVDGMFKAIVVMNEPSSDHIDQYHSATHFDIEKGSRKPVTRMTIELKPSVVVFDELVKDISGFVVKGQPFDVTNPMHVKLVSGYLKRSVMTALIKQTQLDLGN